MSAVLTILGVLAIAASVWAGSKVRRAAEWAAYALVLRVLRVPRA